MVLVDSDKNGKLTNEEVKNVFVDQAVVLSLGGSLSQFDKDKDGVISWDEFPGEK